VVQNLRLFAMLDAAGGTGGGDFDDKTETAHITLYEASYTDS
jgi:hypothetical protein